jgi:hypothetical protein
MRVPFRCGHLTVTDACPVGKGFPRCSQMGQSPRAPRRGVLVMMTTTLTRTPYHHTRIGGFQDQARLALFVSPVGALRASGAPGFRRRGTSGGRCFRHGLFLILESFSSADFGRRPKHSSGFRLAANSYAKDQWAHMRQLGVPAAQEAQEEDDDRRPKWDTAPPTTKREWKPSIALMKKKTAALTELDASAPFRASFFPSCLLHAEADLKPKKDFKEATLQTECGGFLRPGTRQVRRNGLLRIRQRLWRHEAPSWRHFRGFPSGRGVPPSSPKGHTGRPRGHPQGSWWHRQRRIEYRHWLLQPGYQRPQALGLGVIGCKVHLSNLETLPSFPHASIWRRGKDQGGLGGRQASAILGRPLPLQDLLQPPHF